MILNSRKNQEFLSACLPTNVRTWVDWSNAGKFLTQGNNNNTKMS